LKIYIGGCETRGGKANQDQDTTQAPEMK